MPEFCNLTAKNDQLDSNQLCTPSTNQIEQNALELTNLNMQPNSNCQFVYEYEDRLI